MKSYTFFMVIFLIIPSFLLAQESLSLNEMREYFKKNIADGPYTYIQSPRTGFGVGTIYSIVGGKPYIYSAPEDCFTEKLLNKAQNSDTIAVENFDKAGKYSWQVGLKYSNSGPMTDSVKAEFEKNHAYWMVLRIPHLKRQVITIKGLKKAIAEQMDLDCKEVFTTEKKKPERWIIIEALYTDQYQLEFTDANNTQVGISAQIIRTLFPSLRYDKESDYKGVLQFSNQHHIVAVKQVKIKDISKYSGGDLHLEEVQPDAYYNLIDKH